MNKILSFLFAMVFVFAISAMLVAAQEESVSTSDVATEVAVQAEITTQYLGVDDPGILPTSRFYFLKNFTRGVKRVFTFNSVKKAELELNIANEQAAEIAKMKEISPDRVDAIAKAASNYQQNIDRLKTRLDALKETSQNPNVDKLMENLADRSVKHQQLFDELKQKFEDKPELKQNFEKMQEKMNEAIVKIPEKFDSPEMFKERIKKAIEARPDSPLKELRNMEIMEKITENIPEKAKVEMEKMREDFMKKFEDRIGNMPEDQRKEMLRPEILERMPGEPEARMRIMEEIKSRAGLPALKQEIEAAQGKILDKAVEKGEITKEKAEEQIRIAGKAIEALEIAIDEQPGAQLTDVDIVRMRNLLAQAQKHLNEAKMAFEAGKYGEAFGRATSAGMIARNALRGVILFKTQSAPVLKPTPMLAPEARPLPESIAPSASGTGTTILPPKEILPSPPTGIVQPSSGEQIACTQEYLPVCGADGKTYSNACHAKVAGIVIKAPGVCQSALTPIYPR